MTHANIFTQSLCDFFFQKEIEEQLRKEEEAAKARYALIFADTSTSKPNLLRRVSFINSQVIMLLDLMFIFNVKFYSFSQAALEQERLDHELALRLAKVRYLNLISVSLAVNNFECFRLTIQGFGSIC